MEWPTAAIISPSRVCLLWFPGSATDVLIQKLLTPSRDSSKRRFTPYSAFARSTQLVRIENQFDIGWSPTPFIKDIFERKKLCDVPVWRSRHPKLSSYISQAVDEVIDRLQEGTLDKAILAIKDATTDEALEHFVFSFEWLGSVTAAMFKTPQDREKRPSEGTPRSHVDLLLRGLLLKIASLDSLLADLPTELTFTIFIEMSPGHAPPTEPDAETVASFPISTTFALSIDPSAQGEAPRWAPDQVRGEYPTSNTSFIVRKASLGILGMVLSAEETSAKVQFEQRRLERQRKGVGMVT